MPAAASTHGKAKNSFIFHCGDGRYYYINKVTRNANDRQLVAYLRCIHYSTATQCHGTAVLRPENETPNCWKNNQLHICMLDHTRHLVLQLKRDILNVCRNRPYCDRAELVSTLAALVDNDEVAAQVTPQNMRRSMQRAAACQFPAIPPSVNELGNILDSDEYEKLCATEGGRESFFSGSVGPPGEGSVIFVSPRVAHKMRRIGTFYIDGTFKSAPSAPPCCQVLQIVAFEKNMAIPLVQVIMERKSYEAYLCVFEHLQEIIPHFRPRIIVTDFEPALQRACRHAFRNSIVRGCYWHYTRALLKKARKLGLQALARADARVRSLIRCCSAIPLLPKNLMKRGLCVLIRKAEMEGILDNLDLFFSYIISSWFKPSRFDTLSVYDAEYRTNNVCESANKMLRKLTGPHHPNIWHFINAIRKYEYAAHIGLVALSQNTTTTRVRRAAALLNDRNIQDATARLLSGNISIYRFLRRTSCSVYNVFHREFLL